MLSLSKLTTFLNPAEPAPEPAEPAVLEKLLDLTEADVAPDIIQEYYKALQRGIPMEACTTCTVPKKYLTIPSETYCETCGGIGEVPAMAWDENHLNDQDAEDF